MDDAVHELENDLAAMREARVKLGILHRDLNLPAEVSTGLQEIDGILRTRDTELIAWLDAQPPVIAPSTPILTPKVPPDPFPKLAGYTLSDDFTGTTLDLTKWQPNMGDRTYGPWRNRGALPAPLSGMNSGGFDAEYFDPTNVIVNNGLTIRAMRSTAQPGYTWSSGCIRSHDLFTHGMFQIIAKVPSGAGMWAGAWFLDGGGEIDLQESGYGNTAAPNNRIMAINLHTGGNGQRTIDTGIDLSQDFHLYELEYKPGSSLTYYLDGKQVGQYTANVPIGAYEVIIDLQCAQGSLGWHPVVDASTPSPSDLMVEGVRIWTP